jgi:flavin-dependent dehydrogenase
MSSRYDTIVVGARAAGAATALLLGRAGLRVLLVDRSRYGADTLSTHALMRGAVLQLHRWGLLDRIVDAGTPPIRRSTFQYASDRVAISIKPAFGVDALYAPRRTVLDPVLVDAAAEAGVDVRYGVTVTDVLRSTDGRVAGIVGTDEVGHHLRAGAPIVVGADGLRSIVARRVGAPIEHSARAASKVLYGYWSGIDTDGYEWAYRGGAAAGLIPTNDGLTCVFAAEASSDEWWRARHSIHHIVHRASPAMADRIAWGAPAIGVRTFEGRPGYLRRATGPGWALVGDAASWKDPISAHGITDALRDAELLARAIVADSPAALAEYQAERDRLALPLMTAADRIAAYQWSDEEIPDLLLDLNAAMAADVEAIVALDVMAGAFD